MSMRADLQYMLGAATVNSAWNDLAKGVPIPQVLGSPVSPCAQAALGSHCCCAMICSSCFILDANHDVEWYFSLWQTCSM